MGSARTTRGVDPPSTCSEVDASMAFPFNMVGVVDYKAVLSIVVSLDEVVILHHSFDSSVELVQPPLLLLPSGELSFSQTFPNGTVVVEATTTPCGIVVSNQRGAFTAGRRVYGVTEVK